MKYSIALSRLLNGIKTLFGFPFYTFRVYQTNNEMLRILQEFVSDSTATRQNVLHVKQKTNSISNNVNVVAQKVSSLDDNVNVVAQKVSSLDDNVNVVTKTISFIDDNFNVVEQKIISIEQDALSVDKKIDDLDRVYYGKNLMDPCFKKMMGLKNDILFIQETYSQEGESLFVLELVRKFLPQYKGFYVDVGSYHPKKFSNTYALYKMGWSGINIDADPTSIDLFNKERRGDINLNVGVGDVEGTMLFYMFDEPAFNTFDKDKADSIDKSSDRFSLVKTSQIGIQPLNSILEQYLDKGQKIDLLDIDAEGMDENIVFSFDWNRYKPTFVMIEINSFGTIKESIEDNKVKYLEKLGYLLFVKTARTGVFVSNMFYEEYMRDKQVGIM